MMLHMNVSQDDYQKLVEAAERLGKMKAVHDEPMFVGTTHALVTYNHVVPVGRLPRHGQFADDVALLINTFVEAVGL